MRSPGRRRPGPAAAPRWLGALAVAAFSLGGLPAACAAPAPKAAVGPAAEAIRRGIASGTRRFDAAAWDALVSRHLGSEGTVDYAGFRRDRGSLDAFLDAVARTELAMLSRAELLALLVNAYNACTVRLILDNARDGAFPGIRDVADPWGRPICTVGGEALSLDTIEHGLLRPLFLDNRIHAAVNCAARSCPPLAPWAFRGERVDAQLDERMRSMVDSDLHVRIEDGALLVSRIFDWYRADFLPDGGFSNPAPTIRDYLLRHAGPDRRRALEALGPAPKIRFLDYDWSLNGR